MIAKWYILLRFEVGRYLKYESKIQALAPGEVRVDKDHSEDGVEGHAEGPWAEDGDDPGEDDPLEDADVDRVEAPAKGATVHPAPCYPSSHQSHHLERTKEWDWGGYVTIQVCGDHMCDKRDYYL